MSIENKRFEGQAELQESFPLNLPAVELFLDPAKAAEAWPESIEKNEGFLAQIEMRKELVDNLNKIFDLLPKADISFQAAIEQGLVTENQVRKTYDSLTDLLESGDDYRRIIFYLPFEMLPDTKWELGEELKKSADAFRESYMKAWNELLPTHDVRANFVDGDVLEVGQRQGDLPRVVKAAHLIPVLVQKGFMLIENAVGLMDETDDPILKQSISEGLFVMADMGLIPEKKLPENLPEKKLPEEPRDVSERRKKWLEEKEREKSLPPLTEPAPGAERLSGPFSKNLEQIQPEIEEVRTMIRSAEIDPELSQYIYPVILMFGSNLKGYGKPDADIDLGVFIKPGTSFEESEKIQALLNQHFQHERLDQPIEYWLDEDSGKLSIHNYKSKDRKIGHSLDTHILFGAYWEGNIEAIRQLHKRLLTPYFSDNKNRKIYLEQLERDTLQYRLMHKGYQRFFPPSGGIHTPRSGLIDGKSMFYDSGYRQLATRLFASRVFLPKIPNS